MLTETEKTKITLEETYRNVVKTALEKKGKKKSFWASLGSLLNSQFTLWLLGALFVTYGVKYYEDYKAKKDDIKRSEETIDKLNLEIGYRFSQALVRLYKISIDTVQKVKSEPQKIHEIKTIALNLGKSKNDTSTFLYTEYSTWSLLALLAEEKRLQSHLNKNTDKIFNVIGHVSGLEVFYEVRKVNFIDATEVARHIQDELWLTEWKDGGFYFSEGSKESPFP